MIAAKGAFGERDAMINQHHVIEVETAARTLFVDVTDKVKELLAQSGMTKGSVTVYSQHTSCCVIIQEESEDVTYWNVQLILQDMMNALHKIVPPCEYEGQYLHPGPIHIKNAMELRNEKPEWGLNTDGHIISCTLGRSETIPVIGGEAALGEFGRIYFGDLDSVRDRTRLVRVHFFGE